MTHIVSIMAMHAAIGDTKGNDSHSLHHGYVAHKLALPVHCVKLGLEHVVLHSTEKQACV